MARDPEIEGIFTIADDAMQGLWALHMYLKASTEIADGQNIVPHLPENVFQMTHHWQRFYDRNELVEAIRDSSIELLLGRASLISLVAISEAAMSGIRDRP